MTARWTPKAVEKLEEMLLSGKTLEDCAKHFEVSKQRIYGVKNLYLPHLKRGLFGRSVTVAMAEEKKKERAAVRGRCSWLHGDELSRAKAMAFSRKKQNVKATGWEFTITPADVHMVDVCPVLGLSLDWFADGRQENSPSFDRVDPNRGYVPGNVVVMSWRANRIKNDGSAEEHRKIAEYLDKRLGL